ncbi:DUF4041 domain-containing protein [Glutamicibacter sp. 287]|uniref:DUF4041 domain-containing protein n=1 Tax=unclassified Glutamicibacter TaxID=2627139 RepID=UPI001C3E8E54|nr:DUF4041 domain-containing protein [Glutamicibacter sp. BW80]
MGNIKVTGQDEPLSAGAIGCTSVVLIVVGLILGLIPVIGPFITVAVIAFTIFLAVSLNKDRKQHEQKHQTIDGEFVDPPLSSSTVEVSPAPSFKDQAPPQKVKRWGAKKVAEDLAQQNTELRDIIARHNLEDIVELARSKARLEQDVARNEHALLAIQQDAESTNAQLINVRATAAIQNTGLYDYEHPAESSAKLKNELEAVRTEVKRLAREKQAIRASSGFTFNNSAKEGQKFVKQMSTVMLRAYNAEAENCVKAVRAGNLETATKRLDKAREMIERNTVLIDLHINNKYHSLRLQELQLATLHLQAVAAEKEEERARREELREQKKAEAELARKKEQLDREKARYEETYRQLVEQGDSEGAERIQSKLDELSEEQHRVEEYEANFRLGHVYVISNLGAFGEGVVKIGMTRRQDPMDRVRELGDASVPFRFDVHAMFFTEDAVGVETMLHRHFADRRLNKVNGRKEFFYATPDEVLRALHEHNVEVVTYETVAKAEEFRMSSPKITNE